MDRNDQVEHSNKVYDNLLEDVVEPARKEKETVVKKAMEKVEKIVEETSLPKDLKEELKTDIEEALKEE